MSDLNKLLARRFLDEVCGAGRLELLGELIADDYLGNDPVTGGTTAGREDLRAMLARYQHSAPGLAFHILDQVGENDRVATRWQASNSRTCVHGITLTRFLAGRQAESWSYLSTPARPSRQEAFSVIVPAAGIRVDQAGCAGSCAGPPPDATTGDR